MIDYLEYVEQHQDSDYLDESDDNKGVCIPPYARESHGACYVWSGAAPHAFDTHEKSCRAWTLLPRTSKAQQRATLGATVTARRMRRQRGARLAMPCGRAALAIRCDEADRLRGEAGAVLCACRITGQAVNRDEAATQWCSGTCVDSR